MMENSGANNLVEFCPQVAHALKSELVDLKIFQIVFLFEQLGAAYARCATVDAGDLSQGPAQGMLRRLRGTTTGDEDGVVFLIRAAGPKKMMVGAAPVAVLPEPLIFFQVIDGRRIWIPVVEVPDLFCYVD